MARINLEKETKTKRLEEILDPLLNMFVRIKISCPKKDAMMYFGHIIKNSGNDYVLEGISRGNKHHLNLSEHYRSHTELLFKDNSSMEIVY